MAAGRLSVEAAIMTCVAAAKEILVVVVAPIQTWRAFDSPIPGFIHRSHKPARLSTPRSAALMKYGRLPSGS
jgi:hypothetical protein